MTERDTTAFSCRAPRVMSHPPRVMSLELCHISRGRTERVPQKEPTPTLASASSLRASLWHRMHEPGAAAPPIKATRKTQSSARLLSTRGKKHGRQADDGGNDNSPSSASHTTCIQTNGRTNSPTSVIEISRFTLLCLTQDVNTGLDSPWRPAEENRICLLLLSFSIFFPDNFPSPFYGVAGIRTISRHSGAHSRTFHALRTSIY